ncbi:MAG: hypothetical protein H6Q15_914 [Bacteroidetes bacterium]|nr:hypothetical protein [Bacteroidota bacterium]
MQIYIFIIFIFCFGNLFSQSTIVQDSVEIVFKTKIRHKKVYVPFLYKEMYKDYYINNYLSNDTLVLNVSYSLDDTLKLDNGMIIGVVWNNNKKEIPQTVYIDKSVIGIKIIELNLHSYNNRYLYYFKKIKGNTFMLYRYVAFTE